MDEALDRLLSQNVRLSEQSGLLFDDFYLQLVKVRCDLFPQTPPSRAVGRFVREASAVDSEAHSMPRALFSPP